eukprot:877978-Pyramimonas_sp.AAC.1
MEEVFPQGIKLQPEWMAAATQLRMELPGKRRDLKQTGGNCKCDEEFEQIQTQLKEITATLKREREIRDKRRKAELVEAMCIAAEERNFAELHALRCQYSGTGRGPRKR